MPRLLLILLILHLGLAATAELGPPSSNAFVLRISEVQPGALATEQRCTLVFSDRRFHHEAASSKHGRDNNRRVFEGTLSEADWNTLTGLLESKAFHDLNVPTAVAPLVTQDTHIYAISVARGGRFQNIEFLNDKSRRPYEAQLKPLLQWWKSFIGRHIAESHAPANPHCSMDANNALFSQ